MEVCSALSGETLVVLEAHEFEGKSVQNVKQIVAAKIGVSRFRQRLLREDDSMIPDDELVVVSVKVQLLILEFWPLDAKENRKMIWAIRLKDSVELERLLQCPRNPNMTEDGLTALHHAAQNGHVKSIQLLLEANAETDAQESGRATPLYLASANGHLDAVRLLVETGADKELSDGNGLTPMGLAAKGCHLEVVSFLLEAGANKVPGEDDEQTPLGLAAAEGHLDVVGLLIEKGAYKDDDQKSRSTDLALFVATAHFELLRFRG